MVFKTVIAWLLAVGLATAQPHQMMGQFTPQRVFDFTKGSVPSGFVMNRNSIGTRYNAAGVLETIAANQPRISYNPSTGVCMGLLLEESRTNQLTNSADFSDWTSNHVTLTGNAATAPDGSNTAVKIAENNNNEYHYLSRSVSYNSGNPYVLSLFAKAGTRSVFSIQMEFSGSGYAGGFVDLTNGSVTYTTGGAAASQITVNPVGNGWYRILFASSQNGNGGDRLVATVRQNGTQDSQYQGDGSYVYIWGAQFEQGTFGTSYIPTTGNAVTRSADQYSMALAGWYNQAEGTFQCSFNTDAAGVDLRPLVVWDGSNSNRFSIQRNTSNQIVVWGVNSGNSTLISLGQLNGFTTGTINTSFTYRGTDYRAAVNNTLAPANSNSLTPPVVTTLINVPTGRLWLQRTTYYPRRMPTPFLQFLSQ